jgi:hypothetical protein
MSQQPRYPAAEERYMGDGYTGKKRCGRNGMESDGAGAGRER